MKCRLFFFCCLLALSCLASEDRVLLVDQGHPSSVIVLAGKPSRASQLAAFELRHVIWLMTRCRLRIVRDGEKYDDLPIFVGSRDCGRNPEKFLPEEFSISVNHRRIILAGLDEADFGKVDYGNYHTFPSVDYSLKATTYAVYEFLERCCGVRFYYPGDDGIYRESRKTLSVKPMELRMRPAMISSRVCHWGARFPKFPKGVPVKHQMGLLESRWRLNSVNGVVNHNTWTIYFRHWNRATGKFYGDSLPELFIERHPEYFAQGHPGKASSCAVGNRFPGDSDVPPQLCFSNSGPVEYFAWEAWETLQGRHVKGARFSPPYYSGIDYFYPVMEDDNKYWCLCPECKKRFAGIPEKQRAGYQHFDWINRIAKKASQLDSRINIITCAYSNSLLYPDPAILKLEPNIAYRLCLAVDAWYHPGIFSWQHGVYKEWVKNEAGRRQLSVWCYLLSPGFEARSFYRYGDFIPMFYPWKIGQIFQEFVRDGLQGYFAEVDYTRQFLEAYVLNRISWEGKQADPDALIDEYFRLYYGKSGNSMREFYRRMEDITYNPRSYPENIMKKFRGTSFSGGEIHTEQNNLELLTDAQAEELTVLLEQAEEQAENEMVQRRVRNFWEQIWNPAMQSRKNYVVRNQLRKQPLPVARLDELQEQGKDLRTLHFGGGKTWILKNTDARFQNDQSRRMRLAFRKGNLLIRFTEVGKDAWKYREEDIWRNGIELFLGAARSYPVVHIAVSPKGTMVVYRHELVGEVPRISNETMHIEKADQLSSQGWVLTMELPLQKLLPSVTDRRIFLNLIRNNLGAENSVSSWSILKGGAYISNLDRMGTVILP